MKARIVVVPFNPVDHVATVARAGSPDPISINVGKRGGHRDAVADIRKNFAAPVAGDFGDKPLAIAGRATRVRHEGDVSGVSEYLRVPTIAPVIVPSALRSDVNQNQQRKFSAP